MSMVCEIVVTNKFRNTKFFLFQEIPQITNGPSSQIFTTMYQVTDRVEAENDGSSIVEFQMDNNFFAMFGSSRGQGSVARVETSSFRRIRLGPDGSVVALTAAGGGLKWNDAAVVGRQSVNSGSFQFLTDNTIPTNTNSNYIGVGSADPNSPGTVVPTAVYQAEPELNSVLYPKMTFYVGAGDYDQGQLVDRSMLGPYVKIDFEGAQVPNANIILQQDGTWVDNNGQSAQNGVQITTMN
ncbi:hypothetical protein B9Z65_8780 [Elsinoe australis]|uniref:Uncharacterized protein n=1 Tax=Elsinoe australis TaxID=40998 RepID=A0A2P7YER5_9PEZI|nr:hypothetical protein B9Z65_8780 [Elsinoe australis]